MKRWTAPIAAVLVVLVGATIAFAAIPDANGGDPQLPEEQHW